MTALAAEAIVAAASWARPDQFLIAGDFIGMVMWLDGCDFPAAVDQGCSVISRPGSS